MIESLPLSEYPVRGRVIFSETETETETGSSHESQLYPAADFFLN